MMDTQAVNLLTFTASFVFTCCSAISVLYTCRLSTCPRGQVLDISRCRCVRVTMLPPTVNQNLICPNLYCPFRLFPCTSYKMDLSGCTTCECSCFNTICPSYCPYGAGHTVDMNGCEVCNCKSMNRHHFCRHEPCGAFCPNGLEIDQYGCQLCRCKQKKCGSLCRNICPAGRVSDDYGCPTCTCRRNYGTPMISY